MKMVKQNEQTKSTGKERRKKNKLKLNINGR